jgi:hypothetical protein
MTTITATIRQPHVSATWVIAFLAMLVAGLTAALVVSLTSGSTTAKVPAAPAAPTQVASNTGQSGPTTLCPGSVKDWTC